MLRVGLFLDRDGVLNINTHYPHLTEDLYLAPKVMDVFDLLLRYPQIVPVVVTNQSGVGRGYFQKTDVRLFEKQIQTRILQQTGYWLPDNQWYHSYSLDSTHPWRKPNPGMILQAAEDHYIDLDKSCIIGDSQSDIEAGHNAGLKECYHVGTHHKFDLLWAVEDFVNGTRRGNR